MRGDVVHGPHQNRAPASRGSQTPVEETQARHVDQPSRSRQEGEVGPVEVDDVRAFGEQSPVIQITDECAFALDRAVETPVEGLAASVRNAGSAWTTRGRLTSCSNGVRPKSVRSAAGYPRRQARRCRQTSRHVSRRALASVSSQERTPAPACRSSTPARERGAGQHVLQTRARPSQPSPSPSRVHCYPRLLRHERRPRTGTIMARNSLRANGGNGAENSASSL